MMGKIFMFKSYSYNKPLQKYILLFNFSYHDICFRSGLSSCQFKCLPIVILKKGIMEADFSNSPSKAWHFFYKLGFGV